MFRVRQLLLGNVVRMDLAVDATLSDAAGDESTVLGAVVQYHDRLFCTLRLVCSGYLAEFPFGDLQVGGNLQVVAGGDVAA